METSNSGEVLAPPTLKSLYERIQQLFEQKSPGNWSLDNDILKWFNHDQVHAEHRVTFTPSVETLGKQTSEGTMLAHERSLKLSLIQGLELAIELVENENVPADEYATLIFLETKREDGTSCRLYSWRTSYGKLRLDVREVDPGYLWCAEDRVVRHKKKN